MKAKKGWKNLEEGSKFEGNADSVEVGLDQHIADANNSERRSQDWDQDGTGPLSSKETSSR